MKLKLTYFDIEGRGEPVRLALLLSHTPFEDERLTFGEWQEYKSKTPFGQVPMLTIDDTEVRTQSHGMLRWIGKTFSKTLYPEDKMMDIEEALGLAEDVQGSFLPSIYMTMKPELYGLSADYLKTDEGKEHLKKVRTYWIQHELPQRAKYLETLLDRHDDKWLASSDYPTIADCALVVFLRSLTRGYMDHIPADCLEPYPRLINYIQRFCALEEIQGRYTS